MIIPGEINQPKLPASTPEGPFSRYLRVDQVLKFYPFKRAKLYVLLGRKEIRSFVILEPGARRGIRLIDRRSLDEYLEAKANEATLLENKAGPSKL